MADRRGLEPGRRAGGGGIMSGFPEWLSPTPRPGGEARSVDPVAERRERVAKVKRALYNAAYYAAHADELRARRRERYAADPKSAMERITAWRIKNPEVWREISARSSRAYRLRRKQRSGA